MVAQIFAAGMGGGGGGVGGYKTIISFVFQEHTFPFASMPQTIISFVFQEHTVPFASMPKP